MTMNKAYTTVGYAESNFKQCGDCDFVGHTGEFHGPTNDTCPECRGRNVFGVVGYKCEDCGTQHGVGEEARICCTDEW